MIDINGNTRVIEKSEWEKSSAIRGVYFVYVSIF